MNETKENETAIVKAEEKPLTKKDGDHFSLSQIAQAAAQIKLCDVGSVHEALAKLLYGRELGLSPMQSLQSVYTFASKKGGLIAGLLAKTKLAICKRDYPNWDFSFPEATEKKCIFRITKKDGKTAENTFTIEEAQKLGLTAKDNWKWTKNMLAWRACSALLDRECSDVLLGLPSVEDIEDSDQEKRVNLAPTLKQKQEKDVDVIAAATKEEETPQEEPQEDLAPRLKKYKTKPLAPTTNRQLPPELLGTSFSVNELREEIKKKPYDIFDGIPNNIDDIFEGEI